MSPQQKKHLDLVVQDLLDSGFKINSKKSTLETSQVVNHLGFVLNFQEGKVQLVPQKMKGIRKELEKFIAKTEMSKRQISAILGQIRANLLPGAKLQTGSLSADLPIAQKGRVGSKNRCEGRLFSSPSQRGPKAISETQGGGPGL